MAEGEDSFASLIKLCQPTSSQEAKFQDCPFARESETFPDLSDSLSSPAPTPSEVTGILMVSPPDSDSENNYSVDKNASQENDEFQTPPEHHHLSCSSSQEDPRPLKPAMVVNSSIKGLDDGGTIAVDAVCVDYRVNIDLGKEGENLGFSAQKIDGADRLTGGNCGDDASGVQGIEGFERDLKRFWGFEGELKEHVSKKIRVSEGNWDLETHALSLDETETEKVNETEVIELEKIEKVNETEVIELEEIEKVNETEVIDLDCEDDDEGGFDKCKMFINVGLPVKENASCNDDREWNSYSAAKNEEVEKFGQRGSDDGFDHTEEENVVDLDGDEKSGLLAVQESEEAVREKGKNEVQETGKEALGSNRTEDNEKITCECRDNVANPCAKERVFGGKRELPLSIRGKEKDNEEEGREKIVVVKSGSWKELVDLLAVVFPSTDDGCENVDFLETAKRRGLTFPQPRWI